jgi:membrane associated rhomboid family serine protease
VGLVRRRIVGRRSTLSRRTWLLIIVYLVIGVFIAASHHYFAHIGGLRSLGSAILAVLLWPLILLGISLHLK